MLACLLARGAHRTALPARIVVPSSAAPAPLAARVPCARPTFPTSGGAVPLRPPVRTHATSAAAVAAPRSVRAADANPALLGAAVVAVAAAWLLSSSSEAATSPAPAAAEEAKGGAAVVEPSSEMAFEPMLDQGMKLCAVGVRRIFWISTYALGVYMTDSAAMQAALAPSGTSAWLAQYRQGGLGVRLMPTRNTNGGHYRKAWETALKGKLADEALKAFLDLIPTSEIARGSRLDVAWRHSSQVAVTLNGVELGQCSGTELGPAFFGLYLGDQSKTPDLKDAVDKSLKLRFAVV